MIDFREEMIIKDLLPSKNDVSSMTTFFYAFSDDTRLNIIILLMIKPLYVGEISRFLNQNQSTISHQLKILKALDIVDCDRNGKNVIYYIKNRNIQEILNATVDCI